MTQAPKEHGENSQANGPYLDRTLESPHCGTQEVTWLWPAFFQVNRQRPIFWSLSLFFRKGFVVILMHFDVVSGINMLGVFAFAFTGAMKAIREQLDLVGVLVLGLVYALGGGVIRDVLINKIPYAFSASMDMGCAAVGIVAAGVIYRLVGRDVSNCYYIMIPDALGLAIFTMIGAVTAYKAGISGLGLIFLSSITAVGGGAIGDLLLGKIPSVLKDDCYATCSIIGCCCFYVAAQLSADQATISLLSCGITFSIRLLAIQYRWSLPKLNC